MILGLADAAPPKEAIAYQNQLRDLARAWNTRTFTAREALPILDAAVKAATANVAAGWALTGQVHGEVARGHQSDAKRDLAQAQYLRKLMAAKGADSYRFAAGHKVWSDVGAATRAPLVWRSTVVATTGVEKAAQAQLYAEIIRDVTRLPAVVVGGAAGYLVAQVRDALALATAPLGIPAWVAPVAMVAAGLVVLGPYVAPMLGRSISGYHKARRG
jgi:hypothetical protein